MEFNPIYKIRESHNITVSFLNFKPQNFKLSISNPKEEYVAYVSILSRISNYQGLGRKNKHEILKTDRNNHQHTATICRKGGANHHEHGTCAIRRIGTKQREMDMLPCVTRNTQQLECSQTS